jgi:cytochrome c-type biogenesis protein CcmH
MRINRRLKLGALLGTLSLCCVAAMAKEAVPLAQDPVAEAKVMDIAKELRCLVCQNQTIADSNAPLALDLRREVREMVAEGKGRDEIVKFMEDRYGDFVRYRPAFKSTTALLWLGPGLLFVLGLSVLYFNLLRRRKTVDESHPLSQEESERLASLLKEKGGRGDNQI